MADALVERIDQPGQGEQGVHRRLLVGSASGCVCRRTASRARNRVRRGSRIISGFATAGPRRVGAERVDGVADAKIAVPAIPLPEARLVFRIAPALSPRPTPSCGRRSLAENQRQEDHIELIASENYASPAVMAAQGSQLTNKYAEGYPGKRYYGGCEFVDVAEQLAIDRVKKLFGAEAANVQPHSGAQANQAVFFAALKPGDTILGMSLPHGGHLTHGSPVNISGKWFQVVPYGLASGNRAHRLRRGGAARARAQAEAHHRRRVRVFARHRLGALSGRSPTRSARC